MSFIRTLFGDVPTNGLGRCSAHEHLIIDAPYIAEKQRDFLLDDVEAACVDLREFRHAGGGWVVDAMPIGAGRCMPKLATVSQRSGVHVVCPTGLHLPIYYPPDHPMLSMDRGELTELFVSEIVDTVRSEAGPATLPGWCSQNRRESGKAHAASARGLCRRGRDIPPYRLSDHHAHRAGHSRRGANTAPAGRRRASRAGRTQPH